MEKPLISIPYELLPEARQWAVGKAYRTRLVLRQVSQSENGAEFEVVDAVSLEERDKKAKYYMTEGGSYLK